MFLHCLNHWKLETPTARKQQMSSEDVSAYKVCIRLFEIWCLHKLFLQVNYTRWLCYCHVPAFCDSLPHYDTTLIFGRSLLKSVFQVRGSHKQSQYPSISFPRPWGNSCWTNSARRRTKCHLRRERLCSLISQGSTALYPQGSLLISKIEFFIKADIQSWIFISRQYRDFYKKE